MDLGSTIYKLRTAKNLSQEVLAERLGVSRQSVSKWENNTATPDLEKLVKLCDIFELSLDELAGRSKPEPKEPAGMAVSVKNPALPQRKIIGYILLGFSLLAALVFILFDYKFSAYAEWIFLGIIPALFFCSLVSLMDKQYMGYRCFWIICIFSEYSLWRFTIILLALLRSSSHLYKLSVLMLFLIPIPLGIVAASRLLRDGAAPICSGRGYRFVLYWFLLFAAFFGGLNAIYSIPAEFLHRWNGRSILHYIFIVLLTAILAPLFTATFLRLRSWFKQKKHKL